MDEAGVIGRRCSVSWDPGLFASIGARRPDAIDPTTASPGLSGIVLRLVLSSHE